ncbi:MAG: M64 family metallopeptidase [bacterium]|nr:M64 family metallopeptidase [bacterium]
MLKFFKEKFSWHLCATGILSVVFFISFFSLPSFAANSDYCSPLNLTRCNSKIPNLIQTCKECDADGYREWCNTDSCDIGEVCSNGACQASSSCIDSDGDGYGATGSTGCPKSGDCNNNNRDVHPGATETCGNGIDEDCLNGDLTTENWTCGNWSACVEGYKDRICTDANNCPTPINRPTSRETCGAPSITVIYPDPAQNNSFTLNSRPTFKVRITPTPNTLNNVDLYSKVNGGASVFVATLYDDGAHGDGDPFPLAIANDGVWANAITLGSIGKITFELRIGNVPYPFSPPPLSITVTNPSGTTCTSVVDNGDSDDKLDIVYIGDNYTANDLTAFAATVKTFSDAFLATEPFMTQKAKINIHRIDNTVDLRCDYGYGGIARLISCDDRAFVRSIVASACDFYPDEIIVLMNSDIYGGGGYIGDHFAMSYKGDSGVAIHEFGHSFAGLRDEYTAYQGNGSAGTNDDPNCDDTAGCVKWSSISNQCLPASEPWGGCTYDNWYRSIDNGIMRVIGGNTGFGPVNSDVINKIFINHPYN